MAYGPSRLLAVGGAYAQNTSTSSTKPTTSTSTATTPAASDAGADAAAGRGDTSRSCNSTVSLPLQLLNRFSRPGRSRRLSLHTEAGRHNTARRHDLPTAPSRLENVVVKSTLDQAIIQIAPSLGAVTYQIGPEQIQSTPQGENAPFQQILLRAPGVVMDSFGQVHVRGEHGNLTYRINGVLLPEGLNGFSQELDSHLIQSVTLIDGSLPAQFGFHTAGIVDVTTKSGETLKNNEISLYGGSYNTFQQSIELGGVAGKWDYFITASNKHDDIGIENPTSSFRPIHDATNQQKAFAYMSYHIDETSRLDALPQRLVRKFPNPRHGGLRRRFPWRASPPLIRRPSTKTRTSRTTTPSWRTRRPPATSPSRPRCSPALDKSISRLIQSAISFFRASPAT